MPRSKAKSTPKTKRTRKKKQVVKSEKKIKSQKDIDERIASCGRGELQDIIYVGGLVESILQGEFGAILRALLRGKSANDLAESRVKSSMSADRYLGRLDAYEKVWENLEQFVIDKDNALKTLAEDSGKPLDEFQTAPEVGEEILA